MSIIVCIQEVFAPKTMFVSHDTQVALVQVKPRFSYLILALNLSVYAYGLTLRFTKGEDAPLQYFDSLANLNAGIENGEYYR